LQIQTAVRVFDKFKPSWFYFPADGLASGVAYADATGPTIEVPMFFS
jgi:hypothetical protein